jgi:hypothetical protein
VIVEYGRARRNGRQHGLPTEKVRPVTASRPSHTTLLLGRLTLENFAEKYPPQRYLSISLDNPKCPESPRELAKRLDAERRPTK